MAWTDDRTELRKNLRTSVIGRTAKICADYVRHASLRNHQIAPLFDQNAVAIDDSGSIQDMRSTFLDWTGTRSDRLTQSNIKLHDFINDAHDRCASFARRFLKALLARDLVPEIFLRPFAGNASKPFQPRTAIESSLAEHLQQFGKLIELCRPTLLPIAYHDSDRLVVIRGHGADEFDSAKKHLTQFMQIGNAQPEHRIYVGAPQKFTADLDSGSSPPRIISFYTDDEVYRKHGRRLGNQLKDLSITDAVLQEIPRFAEWHEVCAHKAVFVRDQLRKSDKGVLWVDADATVHSAPTHPLFDFADFAIHLHRGWRFASGTVYFNRTAAAFSLLDRWIDLCSLKPLKWDQLLLQEAHYELANQIELKTLWLPQEYTKIFDEKWTDAPCSRRPIIEHHQASREVFGNTDKPKTTVQITAEFANKMRLAKQLNGRWPDVESVENHEHSTGFRCRKWPTINLDYAALVHHLVSHHQKRGTIPYFVKVGTNQNGRNDTLQALVKKHEMHGILIELHPDRLALMKRRYRGLRGLVFRQVAINEQARCPDTLDVSTDSLSCPALNEGAHPSTAYPIESEAAWGHPGADSLERRIVAGGVPSLPLRKVLLDHGVQSIDILQINAEEHNSQALKTLDFSRHLPSVVQADFQNVSESDQSATLELLEKYGYACRIDEQGLCATQLRILGND